MTCYINRAPLLFTAVLCFFCAVSQAKSDTTKQNTVSTVFEDGRTIYVSEKSLTFGFHTTGIGINFRTHRYSGAFFKNYWNFGFSTLGHPLKEGIFKDRTTLFSPNFVFEKINSVLSFRIGRGVQKVLYGKQSKESVEISYIADAGISLIYAKPVFIKALNVLPSGTIETKEERYNPEKHTLNSVIESSFYTVGLFSGEFIPSGYAKFGLAFEYSIFADKVSALELGASLDLSYRKIPIFYDATQNAFFFLNLYIAMSIGSKTER